MSAKIEFSDTGFKQLLKELARMSGKTFEEVLKAEAGRVLQRIIKKTPASGVTQTRKVSLREKARLIKENANRSFKFPSGEVIYTHPKTHRRIFLDYSTFDYGSGDKKPMVKSGKTIHEMDGNRRWSNVRWQKYLSLEESIKPQAADVARRITLTKGVARQSWVRAAEDLGIDMSLIKFPAYVRKARQLSRRQFPNSEGRRFQTKTNLALSFENAFPQFQNGDYQGNVIRGAINARIKAFNSDMQRGVFNDVKKRADRYKGVFVK